MLPGRNNSPLNPDNENKDKTICHLKEQISRLSNDLTKKEATISKLMDLASAQNKRISSLNNSLMDTLIWDQQGSPLPASSTPHLKQRSTLGSTLVPRISLTNRFSILAIDSPTPAAPERRVADMNSSIEFPALLSVDARDLTLETGASRAPVDGAPVRPGVIAAASSTESRRSVRLNILKEAVLGRSGAQAGAASLPLSPALRAPSPPAVSRPSAAAQSLAKHSPVEPRSHQAAVRPVQSPEGAHVEPRSQIAEPQMSRSESVPLQRRQVTDSPAPRSPLQSVVTQLSVSAQSPVCGDVSQLNPHTVRPQPLFPPTAVIIGDSIIRHVRFFNAVTHCFPGATVSRIVKRLPHLLQSLPSSVHRIILHVGTNDISHGQSEITKRDFVELFHVLKPWIFKGMSVYISGPVPTLGRGDERFSRTLYLNTWLSSVCRSHFIKFIDNFNLFWDRPSHYRVDGVHLNWLGSRLLANNILYAVHYLVGVPARE